MKQVLDFRRNTILDLTRDLLSTDKLLSTFDDIPKPPGNEHYFFLASLGLQLKNTSILEFGTHTGNSAYVLAYGNRHANNKNRIITYDIYNKDIMLSDPVNIVYKIEDMFDSTIRDANNTLILSSDLIFIDIDPHEGVMEYEMYIWLKDNDYRGIIVFDDIHLPAGHMNVTSGNSMQQFWDKIDSSYKLDLTAVGHWSGTGLVCFHFENYTILQD